VRSNPSPNPNPNPNTNPNPIRIPNPIANPNPNPNPNSIPNPNFNRPLKSTSLTGVANVSTGDVECAGDVRVACTANSWT